MVKPDNPDARVRFLATKALCGVGGLVLDANGKHFASGLGRSDYVTGEMWKDRRRRQKRIPAVTLGPCIPWGSYGMRRAVRWARA